MARKALGKTLWELIAEAAAGPQNALLDRPKLGRTEDDAKHIRGYFRGPNPPKNTD